MKETDDAQRFVVIDTNCLLQMIGRRSKYRKLWDAFLEGRFIWCVSDEILYEYEELVAQKVSSQAAEMLMYAFRMSLDVWLKNPYYHFHLIELDKDDNKFVDCAVITNADYIVSEDTHFRILKDIPFPNVRIIRLNDFAKDLGLDL